MKLLYKNHYSCSINTSACNTDLFLRQRYIYCRRGTTEATSANVQGTIRHENNQMPAVAAVKLFPSGFNPLVNNYIDSVIADERGNFSLRSQNRVISIYVPKMSSSIAAQIQFFCREYTHYC